MKITILCTDFHHPVYEYLCRWKNNNDSNYQIEILQHVKDISSGGDILFLISCSELIRQNVRDMFQHTLVLHASDLPEGRGWSPHIWDVLNGKDKLTLSLLAAEDEVDTGDIWKKVTIPLSGLELFDEINHKLFEAELKLMDWACENIFSALPKKQPEIVGSYHRKRTPEDGKIDINKSILSQFNLLRVSDPIRYPAFVVIQGQKFKIKLEKIND